MSSAYITFHVYNYGVGFTKNILGAFYSGKLNPEKLDTGYLLQKDLEENSFRLEKPSGQHVFDKIYYLYVNKETITKVTSTRKMKKITVSVFSSIQLWMSVVPVNVPIQIMANTAMKIHNQ